MRWVDWFFQRVYLPSRRKWARARVEELVREREQLYARLMDEVRRTAAAVEASRSEDDDHAH
jgi:hypothetical protein